jgi:hypothetical protein
MKIIHRRDTEFTEIGLFLNQELFSLRPLRLRGESSESFVDFVRSMVRICYRAASMINNTRRICVGGENF